MLAPGAASQRGSRDGGQGDPRNFLLSGGSRALDGEKAAQQAAAARAQARSMKGANAALAAELSRVRHAGQREGGALRGELAALAGRFRAEQVCGAAPGRPTNPLQRRKPGLLMICRWRAALAGRIRGEPARCLPPLPGWPCAGCLGAPCQG